MYSEYKYDNDLLFCRKRWFPNALAYLIFVKTYDLYKYT